MAAIFDGPAGYSGPICAIPQGPPSIPRPQTGAGRICLIADLSSGGRGFSQKQGARSLDYDREGLCMWALPGGHRPRHRASEILGVVAGSPPAPRPQVIAGRKSIIFAHRLELHVGIGYNVSLSVVEIKNRASRRVGGEKPTVVGRLKIMRLIPPFRWCRPVRNQVYLVVDIAKSPICLAGRIYEAAMRYSSA